MFSNSLSPTSYQVSAHHRRELAQHAIQERTARACNGSNGDTRRHARLLRMVMALSSLHIRRRNLHSAIT